MKNNYILLAITLFLLNGSHIIAQTVWTGAKTTFTKVDDPDWTLEANQDRITDNVWITRGDKHGLFNAFSDTWGDNINTTSPSTVHPRDTEWAFGTTADYTTLEYKGLTDLVNSFDRVPNRGDMVLHLITDDIYIDINILSWSVGNGIGGGSNGGGFSYERSTDQSLSANEFDLSKVTLFPNPSSGFIQLSGLTKTESYSIYNIIGVNVKNGTISNQKEIDIRNFTNGLYFLKFDNGNTIKFIKE